MVLILKSIPIKSERKKGENKNRQRNSVIYNYWLIINKNRVNGIAILGRSRSCQGLGRFVCVYYSLYTLCMRVLDFISILLSAFVFKNTLLFYSPFHTKFIQHCLSYDLSFVNLYLFFLLHLCFFSFICWLFWVWLIKYMDGMT